jgi:hypothetical protein
MKQTESRRLQTAQNPATPLSLPDASATFLRFLLSDPEDEGNIFLRNVGHHNPEYRTLHSNRLESLNSHIYGLCSLE